MELIETADTNNYGMLETNPDNSEAHKSATPQTVDTNKHSTQTNTDIRDARKAVVLETCVVLPHCPVEAPSIQSDPICGRKDDTSHGVTILCAKESPSFWGGSFDFNQAMPNIIYDIITNTNRKDHCSIPTGVGSNLFHVHCACGGGCLIEGSWKVLWNVTQ